jgi:hypothetical protein
MLDQATSGLSNVVTTIVVARAVSAEEFGAFSVGFIAYMLALGLIRGLVGQPLAIRHSATSLADRTIAAAAGAAVLVGAAASAVLVLAGLMTGGSIGTVLLAFAAAMPVLMVQDVWRFAAFTAGRPGQAVAIDAGWLLVQVPLLAAVAAVADTPAPFVAAWGLAGALSAGAGAVLSGAVPSLVRGWAFLRTHADLGPRYAGESLIHTGSSQVTTLLLGGIVGAAGIGALRGGQVLFGPYYTLMTGLVVAAVSEGARVLASQPHRLVLWLRVMSALLVTAAAMCGAVLLLMPDDWGRALLGATWAETRGIVMPLTVGVAGYGVAAGGDVGLRVLAAARETFRIRVVAGLLVIVCGVVGALAGGLQGAAWGMAAGPWMTAVAMWWALHAVGARPSRSLAATPARLD